MIIFTYAFFILLQTIQYPDTYRSSASQNSAYPRFCCQAAHNEKAFSSFRNNIVYRDIVETLGYGQGLDFATYIRDHVYSWVLPQLDKICSEDKIGNPLRYNFPSIGEIAPTTLRYMKVATDLREEFGDLSNFNIVEIGGGYGGQCKIVNDLFGFKSYTIIDIPECMPLINKYLSLVKVPNVVTKNNADIKGLPLYDLVISNYAFSEIDRQEQLNYFENIIKAAPRGYMIYNQMPPINPLSVDEFVALLTNNQKKVRVQREIPNTCETNVTIIWHPLNDN